MNHTPDFTTISKGAFGLLASLGGVFTSFLSQLEILLRIASLTVGLTVGILTIASLLRARERERHARNAEQRRRHFRDAPFDEMP